MIHLRVLTKVDNIRIEIDWEVIKPSQVKAFSHMKRMGLMLADAVAGSFFAAVQRTKYGFTKLRYAIMLKPVIFKKGKSFPWLWCKNIPRTSRRNMQK